MLSLVGYESAGRDMQPAANLNARKRAMRAGLQSLRQTTGADFGYDVALWREYLIEAGDAYGYTHPWAYSGVDSAVVAAIADPNVIAALDLMSQSVRCRTQSNTIQSLLRATPDDLPALLTAAGLTETPEIDDDPDPDIGLSWCLPQTGIEISFDNGHVSTVFLYGPPQRNQHYADLLPLGIEWSTSFDTAIEILGPPSRHSHGDDTSNRPLGTLPPWLRYDDDDVCVHIQFTPNKSQTAMVSVMTTERAP